MIKGKGVPAGVKIISVLFFLSTLYFIYVIIKEAVTGNAALVFGGPLLFLTGILFVFVGLGLWKGQVWARIVAIIVAIILFLLFLVASFIALAAVSISLKIGGAILYVFLYTLLYEAVPLVVSAAVAIYLLFNKKVKTVFKK